MLRHNISLLLQKIDEILGSIIVLTIGEKPGLISVLFHSLFLNKKQINQNIIDPQQRITIDLFEEVIRYFFNHNYQFVSPLDLEKGLLDGKFYSFHRNFGILHIRIKVVYTFRRRFLGQTYRVNQSTLSLCGYFKEKALSQIEWVTVLC